MSAFACALACTVGASATFRGSTIFVFTGYRGDPGSEPSDAYALPVEKITSNATPSIAKERGANIHTYGLGVEIGADEEGAVSCCIRKRIALFSALVIRIFSAAFLKCCSRSFIVVVLPLGSAAISLFHGGYGPILCFHFHPSFRQSLVAIAHRDTGA